MKGELDEVPVENIRISAWNGYFSIFCDNTETGVEEAFVIDARRANCSASWMDEPFVSLWQEDEGDFEHSVLFTTRGIAILPESAIEAKAIYSKIQSVVRNYYDYNWFYRTQE